MYRSIAYRSIASSTRLHRFLTTAAFAMGLVLAFAQVGGHAQTVDPLSYSGGILVTGNYTVGTVDLTEALNPPDAAGLSTGTINIRGVPVDADIVSATLVWETITLTSNPGQASAMFRGQNIVLDDPVAVKKSHEDLVGNVATCWTSGTPVTMWRFRADVLRLLPVRLDKNNQPTNKRLVNDADLIAHGQPLHTVSLPTRSGNQIPETAGATLIIVYRDPSQPLRKIVFYDGIHIQTSLTDTLTQTLQGFYKSSATKSATITHMLGSGQPNNNERIFFNDGTETQISPFNPVQGTGTSSERTWSALTYDVSSLMNPGNNSGGGFGETATTKVDHSGGGGYDCLTAEGIVFSTAVADNDPNPDGGAPGDGIPDGLEDAGAGLTDPDGQPIPNLNAMGASSSHRDLFIEINAMRTLTTKNHGSASAPYNSAATPPQTTLPVPPHTHMPTPEVLKLIGDGYLAHGIAVHFDVGDITAYHSLGVFAHSDWLDDYTSTEADSYLVAVNPRGGEVVDELACSGSVATCQFPDFPGTVSWKAGLQLYRDAPVGSDGQELLTDADVQAWQQGTDHRRRFDRNRRGLFHYLFYGHARGIAKSDLPCLDTSTDPDTPTANGYSNGICSGAGIIDNPDFHVPSSSSGVADLPGGNAMITLGRWDEFVAKPFVRASTTFHELGHNLNLWHGGSPAVVGNKALNTATRIEPNCKPVYLSSMSYLFQVHGLFDDADGIHLDLSGTQQGDITESTSPSDLPLSPTSLYRPAWYAPSGSALATSLGVSAAKAYCNGVKFDPAAPTPPSMARVFALLSNDPIDWDGDGILNAADPMQDVNFDASLATVFHGFNDWTNLRLDQISAGQKVARFEDGSGGVFTSDTGGIFTSDTGGVFTSDTGGVFTSDTGGVFTSDAGGVFTSDTGGVFTSDTGGVFTSDTGGAARQELDFESAKALGRSGPFALTACIVGGTGCLAAPQFDPNYHGRLVGWHAPTYGHVALYQVSRKRGPATSTFPYVSPVPTSTSTTASFIDTEQLPDGVQFSYRSRAEFDDQTPHVFSAFSKPVTISAVNNPPTTNADAYTTPKNKALKIGTQAAGVLGNDTDVDSPASFIKAVLVNAPSSGTLVLNADGSFTYTPKNGFTGVDSFSYKANNGFWSADPTVRMNTTDSDPATVTIAVTAK